MPHRGGAQVGAGEVLVPAPGVGVWMGGWVGGWVGGMNLLKLNICLGKSIIIGLDF